MSPASAASRTHRPRVVARRVLLAFFTWLMVGVPPASLAQVPRWVQLPPPPLATAPAVFDPLRDRILIFGGPVDARGRRTIWSFLPAGGAWKEIEFSGDVPLIQPNAMVLDPVADRLLLYAGPTAGPTPAGVFALNLGDPLPTWVPLSSTGTPPTSRSDYSVVFDPVRYRLLVFGGYIGGTFPRFYGNSVWALSLSGTPEWTELAPTGQPPKGRGGHAAVYDPVHDRMVVHGGFYPDEPPIGANLILDECWALSLSGTPAWQFLPPAGSVPAARRGHVAAVEPGGPGMVVFGGLSAFGAFRNDAWVLDLAASTTLAYWTQVAPGVMPAPEPRWGAGACWDPPRQRMLIHGGFQQQGQQAVPAADTWALVPGVPAPWTALGPAGLAPPATRYHASLLDAAHGRLYVIGGQDDYSLPNDDTWSRPLALDEGWVRVSGSGPGARAFGGAWADPTADRALLYGGEVGAGGPPADQMLSFGFAGANWSPLATAPVPPARSGPCTIFDEFRRRFLVYGGAPLAAWRSRLEDTWAFDAATGNWENLTATSGSFGPRSSGASIWDPVRDRMIVFGGEDSLGQDFNDVHVLPLGAGGAWAPLATSGDAPPANSEATATYDAAGDRMLVFASSTMPASGEYGVSAWALTLADPPTWSSLAPTGRLPSVGFGYTTVADPARGRILLHGGAFTRGPSNQTWAFYLDETTPVALALVSAEAATDRVRLRWQVSGGSALLATVQRSVLDGPWTPIATVVPDGRGELAFEDHEVVSGQQLRYRLSIMEGGVEQYFGEVTVTIPQAATLRLHGVRPNPVTGDSKVAFELAGDALARLELLDVAGRRVLVRPLDGLQPGAHVVALNPGRVPIRAGLYFLRLSQAGRVITRRVVVTP